MNKKRIHHIGSLSMELELEHLKLKVWFLETQARLLTGLLLLLIGL